MGNARRACLWVVAIHTAVAFVHNQAHRQIDVSLSNFQSTYALVVIVIAPAIAAAIIWRGHPHRGANLLVISMLASVVFGIVNHFMIDSPDQLAHIANDGWGNIFTVTAYALALTELVGIAAGLSLRRSPSH
ncbi:MAG: hypothetical protein ABI570_04535 [Ilumatobacteraceae bacterium]